MRLELIFRALRFRGAAGITLLLFAIAFVEFLHHERAPQRAGRTFEVHEFLHLRAPGLVALAGAENANVMRAAQHVGEAGQIVFERRPRRAADGGACAPAGAMKANVANTQSANLAFIG
ncbi:MAG: hypothetical protein WDN76_00165 [Alphaproteobacteria bacterium]